MPKVALYDVSGAQIGELELNDNIFGIEPNQAVLYDFVKMQLSNKGWGPHRVKPELKSEAEAKNPGDRKALDEPG